MIWAGEWVYVVVQWDEGGDAAVVAENGSVVAVAILKTVSGATGCKTDCCTGTDTVLISMSVLIRGVGRSHRVQMAKEQRNSKKRETFVVVVDYSVQRERDIVWFKLQKNRDSVELLIVAREEGDKDIRGLGIYSDSDNDSRRRNASRVL